MEVHCVVVPQNPPASPSSWWVPGHESRIRSRPARRDDRARRLLFATGDDVPCAPETRDGDVLWQHTRRTGRGRAHAVTNRTVAGRVLRVAIHGGSDAELVSFTGS